MSRNPALAVSVKHRHHKLIVMQTLNAEQTMNREQILDLVETTLGDAVDKIIAECGLNVYDMFFDFPWDGQAQEAYADYTEALTEILLENINWKAACAE